MKRLIPLAILSITMALPTFLTSCSSDDELLPDTPEVLKPTITNWIEPWHIQGSGIDEVKAYMSTSMYGYTLTNESSSTANYQLVYSGSYESTGVIYSFTKHEGGLYSVIDTELCVNKSVIIKYLKTSLLSSSISKSTIPLCLGLAMMTRTFNTYLLPLTSQRSSLP